MKNLILSLLTVFAFSFSLAQSNDSKENAMQLKKNSVEVVDYIASELELVDKQKAVIANAFAEYAANVSKLNDKLSAKEMSNEAKNKMTFEKMAEFTGLRDKRIMRLLTEAQYKKYSKISNNWDPMTLTLNKKKTK